jgi:single-strand DNA-binding protein
MLIGNVGNDPEVRSTSNGGRVANFNVATTRVWNGPNGDRQEKTEWHRCVVWNQKGSGLADVVDRYVKKGDRLYVEGRIEYRQWQGQDGQTRYSTEVNVRELIMLGSRGGGGGDAGEGEGGSRSRSVPERARAGAPAANNDDFEDFPGALEDEEDDLPF